MKKFFISIFALTLLLTIANSCRNDFLDVQNTDKVSTADLSLYNNDEGAKSFVTAIYSKLRNWNESSFSWMGMASVTSDDADKGSDPGDTGTDKDQMDALTFNSSSLSVREVFEANYQGINRVNQALEILPQLNKANPALVSRLIGEAKFLRAVFYFNLVRCYGGVPIVDHVPSPSSDADKTMQLSRKTKEEVYAFIEKDLTDAIAALPDRSSYTGSDVGRASKGSALGLMTKVELYQKKWQKVLDYSNLLSGYSLTPSYADIFKVSGENNQESLFEIQAVGGTPSAGIEGFSASQGARGAGGWGWGFNTPSATLANSYESGDLRKNATIIFAGSTLYDGRFVPTTVSNPRYNYKAYSSLYPDAWESDQNMRILRYADVILMKAEANNELGNTASAIPFVNQIRNRAGLANTTATTQTAIRTAIYNERRHELAMEYDRWFDIIRTGQAQAVMAADGKTFVIGKHELFPIPQTFLTQAAGYSSQNPGY